MNILCNILSTILIMATSSALFFIARYFYLKTKNTKLMNDMKILSHITHLMPWIYAQLNKSVEVILDKYKIEVSKGTINRNIDIKTYKIIINDIRTHFYGTIPEKLSKMIFEYINQKQIEILLLSEFRLQNQNYFTIIKEDVGE